MYQWHIAKIYTGLIVQSVAKVTGLSPQAVAATSRLVSAVLNIAPYKVIWDPGSWIFDALIWNWIPDSLWVEFGFRIPSIVSGIRDSLSWIPGSKAQDSGFSRILESKYPYMGR